MRSSKSRSRNKQRNRSVGNIVNRVFDSSGPEGKVRGTPQQIIDKYNQLARDAQLSGDRVATENFQQHAEHYTRMLAEAQREQDQKREQQDQQQRDRQQNNGGGNNNNHNNRNDQQPQGDDNAQGGGGGQTGGQAGGRDQQPQAEQPQQQKPSRGRSRPKPAEAEVAQSGGDNGDVIDFGNDGDSGLVETPESKPEPKPARKPRARKPKLTEETGDSGNNGEEPASDATAAE